MNEENSSKNDEDRVVRKLLFKSSIHKRSESILKCRPIIRPWTFFLEIINLPFTHVSNMILQKTCLDRKIKLIICGKLPPIGQTERDYELRCYSQVIKFLVPPFQKDIINN